MNMICQKTKQDIGATEHIVYDEIMADKPQIVSELIDPRKIHGIIYRCAGYTIHSCCRRSIMGFCHYTAKITNQNKRMFDVDIESQKLVKQLYQHANQYC